MSDSEKFFMQQEIDNLKKEINFMRSSFTRDLLNLQVMIQDDEIDEAIQYIEDLTSD